jgi:hypothetical protein
MSVTIITMVLGILLLLMGRRLFWLFVGTVGFIAAMTLVPMLQNNVPHWQLLLVSLAMGFVGAILAIFLQRAAVAVAGFFGGGYLALRIIDQLGLRLAQIEWVLFIGAGIVSAIFLSMLLDPALIVLSSLAGALLIVNGLPLGDDAGLVAFISLSMLGMLVQSRLSKKSN